MSGTTGGIRGGAAIAAARRSQRSVAIVAARRERAARSAPARLDHQLDTLTAGELRPRPLSSRRPVQHTRHTQVTESCCATARRSARLGGAEISCVVCREHCQQKRAPDPPCMPFRHVDIRVARPVCAVAIGTPWSAWTRYMYGICDARQGGSHVRTRTSGRERARLALALD